MPRLRPRRRELFTLCVASCAVAVAALAGTGSQSEPRRHLLIIVDGLRPDYVTPEVMPALSALAARGVTFRRHHSVFPTVTRVNASSIATGAYPEAHGLLGNSVFFPRVDPGRFLDTADHLALIKVRDVEGQLLTAPTLAEALQAAGRRMLVVSSGSAGSAFLNNPQVAGGAILHHQYALPEDLAREMETLGPVPAKDGPAGALDRYAVDALLKVGLPRIDPSVTTLWLSDLDSTAHEKGIGNPSTVAMLRLVDANIARIEEGLKTAGVFDRYNIWVSSDHGFTTYTGGVDLAAVLEPFTRTMPDGSPGVVASGGAIYVRGGGAAATASIVSALQRTAGIGAIFTEQKAVGALEGNLPGTLSFGAARWAHARSAQILFSPDWTDAPNVHGWRGTAASSGTAGHGSASPWDIHNTLVAAGPDLRRGAAVDLPSGNVDFAPTFLTLLGLPLPSTMQGRPLAEAFAAGNTDLPVTARTLESTVRTPDGRYILTGTFSVVETSGKSFRYFDQARVLRKAEAQHP